MRLPGIDVTADHLVVVPGKLYRQRQAYLAQTDHRVGGRRRHRIQFCIQCTIFHVRSQLLYAICSAASLAVGAVGAMGAMGAINRAPTAGSLSSSTTLNTA